MERRKKNHSYAKLLHREKQRSRDSNGIRTSISSTESVISASTSTSTLQRSRSMRASFRLLKGKLHNPQALFQSPFKRYGNGQLSFRRQRVGDAKQKAIKSLNEVDRSILVQTKTKTTIKSTKTKTKFKMLQESTKDLTQRKDKMPSRQDNCGISNVQNKEQIEALISQLPLGAVPRKACKLLQIPETYCEKYLKEQQQQQHQQQKEQPKQKYECKPQSQQENAMKNLVNKNGLKVEDNQEIHLQSDQTSNHKMHQVHHSQRTVEVEMKCEHEKQPPQASTVTDSNSVLRENSDFYTQLTQAVSTGIYGTTRMRTATIRRPMPYLNSHNILPTTLTQQQKQRLEHINQRLSTHNDDENNDYDEKNIQSDSDDKILTENFVILRRNHNTKVNYNKINNYNHNNNSSLKYYNHNDYDKTNKNLNGKSLSTSNSQKSHDNHKNKYHHEFPLFDQCERDDTVLYAHTDINSNCNSSYRWSTQQWGSNVSVTKIRNAVSCTSQDLREMEFLLPQHHNSTKEPAIAAATKTTNSVAGTHQNNNNNNHTNNNNNNNNINCNTNGTSYQHNHASIAEQASKLLHISRHSHHERTATHTDDARMTTNPIKLKEGNENRPQSLLIHRQPAHARTKCGSTPPHRTKMSKKQFKLAQAQLDKLTQINLHLHALFSAVEHGHLDKARTILESTDVDVNSINADGLSALDVAVLSNNRSMTKMLLQHGAVEGTQFSTDTIGSKLNGLLKDAESRIHDLSGPADTPIAPVFTTRPSISSIIIGNTSSSVTGCTGSEIDKQIGIWERRVKGLRRMLLGWDQITRPDSPASVTVDVTGENSIALQILEPFEGAIGTKFKVQWSTRADFSNVVGEREIIDWSSFHGNMGAYCNINGLTQGRRYFVRAARGNVKGWGPYKTSVPASVVPSSWRDLNNREDRYLGRQRALDSLFTAVRLARPADVSELSLETTNVQRRNPKKKTTIKQLFSVASKFQKSLRRGIYLASIIYCEDKVLVTSEDILPVIEIDETYPSSLHSDYHWLMKVACTWDDVKSLRTDMERNLTSAVHFRTKLLSAICQMQSALGINDLGQLYYKPLRDSHGTVVLTCIQSVRSQKSVSILNSRWLPVNKLQKKVVALMEDYNINDMLISSISEQMHYHQASMQRLPPGLYLGYLKMQCSVDQIQVVVPVKTPNVLPHYKVRENSHITAEEWQILKCGSQSDQMQETSNLSLPLEFSVGTEATTEGQRLFLYDLTNAAHKLFTYMNIKSADAATHRLYDIEVIEHSKDISFLIICPSVELTCAAPGQSEILLQRDDLASLSIQAFEMIHLRTYQTGIIQKYARLSCILELDTALANHSQREAFSTSELQTAKERLAKLQELSASLNMVWKSVRWLMDVIAFARDKSAQPTLAMREILDFSNVRTNEKSSCSGSNKQQLLQLPIGEVKFTKTGSGRGSWPGPAANSSSNSESEGCFETEHSKSEQNLGFAATTPSNLSPSPQTIVTNTSATTSQAISGKQLLKITKDPNAPTDGGARKNSGDSVTSQSYYSGAESAASSSNELGAIFAIPPSRSDDTLALASNEASKHVRSSSSVQRKRASSNLPYTNPTTPLITVHCSSSAPYLAQEIHGGSNLSLKSNTYNPNESTNSSFGNTKSKAKAASSINLRDTAGSNYLKTTLSALQSEIKNATCEERVASSTKSLSRQSSEEDTAAASSAMTEQASTSSSATSSGIIQVYTAYNTGLASGTSLKLHVTPRTTAREVINLVVKQLNMAAVLKGSNGPIYTTEMLDNFCLVAVIGARERCLRDDFKPLQLQNPWKKGRLYVRQKHELLAAIEHSNRKSHLI